RIKQYRELRNYTQMYMSEQLGISQNTYSKLESGGIKLTVERLRQIAEILDVSLMDLLNNSNQPISDVHDRSSEKNHEYLETIQIMNKDLVLQVIGTLNEQINYLRKENERLMEILSNLSKK